MEKRSLIMGFAFLLLLSAGYLLLDITRPSGTVEAPDQTTPAQTMLPPQVTAPPEIPRPTPPPSTAAPGEEFVPHINQEWYVAQTAKRVTGLEAVKGKTKDWDRDGANDGFVFYLKPLAEDETVVPVDAKVEVEIYNVVPGNVSGVLYWKNELLYSAETEIEAEKFIVYEILGEVLESQEIRVAWGDIEQYSESLDDNGFLYATIEMEDGSSFSANLGENDPSKMVPLRESNES